MKKGKIILGLVAAAVTVGSAMAFRVVNKFTSHNLFLKTSGGLCALTCHNLFFTGARGGTNTVCTINTSNHINKHGGLISGVHKAFWTARTVGKTCQNTVTVTTNTQ